MKKIKKILTGTVFLIIGCVALHEPKGPNIKNYLPDTTIRFKPAADGSLAIDAPKERVVPVTGDLPLDLEACIRIALDKNPLNQATQEGVNVAKEAVGESRAPYYPEIGARAGYSYWQKHAFLPDGVVRPGISSTIGPTDDWSTALEARYTLFDSGKRLARLRTVIAEQGVAQEDAERIRQDIAFEVHRDFYGMIAAQETLFVAKENLERDRDHLRLTQAHWAAGAVPKADVLRAEVAVANAKLKLVRAESLVRIARGNLNTSMGLPVEISIEISSGPVEVTSPDKIDLSKSFKQAVDQRPILKRALQSIVAAQYSVEEAKSAFGPNLHADSAYGWRDDGLFPEDEEWLVGINMELPLFTGFSRKHKLAGKKAELKKQEAEAKRRVQEVRSEVWSAYSKLQETFEAIMAAEVLVKDARESLRTARKRYEVGAGTINDLLDAQTELAGAEATQVTARWDHYVAKAQFNRSIGNLIGEMH